MTAVTDLNDATVAATAAAADADGERATVDGEAVCARRGRVDALRDSVVARLLTDSRPPPAPPRSRLHAAAATIRRSASDVGTDLVRRAPPPTTLPPPVNLSAAKSVAPLKSRLSLSSTAAVSLKRRRRHAQHARFPRNMLATRRNICLRGNRVGGI